jgi:hypothetical protein
MPVLYYDRIPATEEMFLMADLKQIADSGTLPDGDGVNIPTKMWAEDWIGRLYEENKRQISVHVDASHDEGRRGSLVYRLRQWLKRSL